MAKITFIAALFLAVFSHVAPAEPAVATSRGNVTLLDVSSVTDAAQAILNSTLVAAAASRGKVTFLDASSATDVARAILNSTLVAGPASRENVTLLDGSSATDVVRIILNTTLVAAAASRGNVTLLDESSATDVERAILNSTTVAVVANRGDVTLLDGSSATDVEHAILNSTMVAVVRGNLRGTSSSALPSNASMKESLSPQAAMAKNVWCICQPRPGVFVCADLFYSLLQCNPLCPARCHAKGLRFHGCDGSWEIRSWQRLHKKFMDCPDSPMVAEIRTLPMSAREQCGE